MKAILFRNFSDESFTWKFDGDPYTFEAGQEMYMEDFKAQHFAKHLIDRELNKEGIPTNAQGRRSQLEALCFPALEAITPAEAIDVNTRKTTKTKAKKVEEEFPELKTK